MIYEPHHNFLYESPNVRWLRFRLAPVVNDRCLSSVKPLWYVFTRSIRSHAVLRYRDPCVDVVESTATSWKSIVWCLRNPLKIISSSLRGIRAISYTGAANMLRQCANIYITILIVPHRYTSSANGLFMVKRWSWTVFFVQNCARFWKMARINIYGDYG